MSLSVKQTTAILAVLASTAAALPASSPSALYSANTNSTGTHIWVSKAADTIFGRDATAFDYLLTSDSAPATQAIEAYAAAVSKGDETDLITKFLNATMAGTLKDEHAADHSYLCNELGASMAPATTLCKGLDISGLETRSALERRSRWKWVQKAAHISSNFAMNALAGVFGNAMYNNFPTNPRSICNSADGTNACFSYSMAESFNEGYAKQFVTDALGVVDFNQYSAQANKVLTNQKRAGAADVCLSNRADGCT